MRGENWRRAVIPLLAVMLTGAVTACGQTDNRGAETDRDGERDALSQAPVITKEPLKLVFAGSVQATEEEFMRLHGGFVQKKYPNFTFERKASSQISIPDRLAAGEEMDILIISGSNYNSMVEMGIAQDLSDLIEKFNFDLTDFEPSALDTVRKASNGMLGALPYRTNAFTLYYNRDIFDKFGVPYPRNGMTWDDAYALSRQMTRVDNGVQYYGLGGFRSSAFFLQNQYGLEPVDPKTNKATFGNEQWKRFFDNFTRFYDFPGYFAGGKLPADSDLFKKDKTMAMLVDINGNYTQALTAGLNFDMVHLPTFPELPEVGSSPSVTLYVISSQSKHKEEAFAALTALLSVETQLEKARGGSDSPLNNPVIQREFGADIPGMEGRNPQNMRMSKLASPVTLSSNTAIAVKSLQTAFDKVVSRQADVNTALREAANEADKAIAENESMRK